MTEQKQDAGAADQFVLENESDRSRTPVGEAIRVGRDPSCDLVLSSEKASRVHARLSVAEGSLRVEDQNSTNGTFVNKQKVQGSETLEDGDIVQFGDVRFRVIAPTPAGEAADQGTVIAGQATMLHAAEDDEKAGETEPGKPKKETAEEKSAGSAKPQPAKKAKAEKAQARKAKAKKTKAGSGSPAETGESAERKPEADPEEPESPSVESRAGKDPSIPRSWADADQLEQASHTAFVARPSAGATGSEAGGLNPAKAVAEARRSIPANEAILVGLTEPVEGKPFKLSRKGGTEKWEMGRGEGADIAIDDESVSGRHAQLICEDGRWKVVNMMSVNGTFVNDRKVLSAYLSPHDVIRMGTVRLVFDARVERPRPEPQPQPEPESPNVMSKVQRVVAGLAQQVVDLWNKIINRLRGGS